MNVPSQSAPGGRAGCVFPGGSATEAHWVCLGTPKTNAAAIVAEASLAVKAYPRGGEATA